MGVNLAALELSVSHTTHEQNFWRVIHGTNFDPQPYLTSEEESWLTFPPFFCACGKSGCGKPEDFFLRLLLWQWRTEGE